MLPTCAHLKPVHGGDGGVGGGAVIEGDKAEAPAPSCLVLDHDARLKEGKKHQHNKGSNGAQGRFYFKLIIKKVMMKKREKKKKKTRIYPCLRT